MRYLYNKGINIKASGTIVCLPESEKYEITGGQHERIFTEN